MPEAEPVLELRRRIDDEDRLATRKLPAVRLPAFDLGSQPDEVTIPLRPAIRRPSVRQVPPPPALPLPLVLKPSVPPVVETLPPPRSRGKLPALLGAGLALLGALVGTTIVVLAAQHSDVPSLGAGLGQLRLPAAAASPALVQSCKAAGAAKRLAPIVPPGATIDARVVDAGLAVGIATSGKRAQGITVDPETLEQKSRELFEDPVHVGGVVPLADGTFAVDRYSVRVDARPEFSVGMTPAGFSRILPDGSQQVIWPGESTEIITRPTVLHAPGVGYVVGFRRGSGSVRVGWISEQGEKKSELASYASGAVHASEPALSVSADGLVVAFSEEDVDGDWSLHVGKSALGDLPAKTPVLSGSGAARTPAVAPLAGGRTLVAWTDVAGHDLVRGQVLDAELSPVAPSMAWFDLERRADSLALESNGSRAALLLSLPATPVRSELWALPVTCK